MRANSDVYIINFSSDKCAPKKLIISRIRYSVKMKIYHYQMSHSSTFAKLIAELIAKFNTIRGSCSGYDTESEIIGHIISAFDVNFQDIDDFDIIGHLCSLYNPGNMSKFNNAMIDYSRKFGNTDDMRAYVLPIAAFRHAVNYCPGNTARVILYWLSNRNLSEEVMEETLKIFFVIAEDYSFCDSIRICGHGVRAKQDNEENFHPNPFTTRVPEDVELYIVNILRLSVTMAKNNVVIGGTYDTRFIKDSFAHVVKFGDDFCDRHAIQFNICSRPRCLIGIMAAKLANEADNSVHSFPFDQ